jgi:hypothetical protein
VRSRPSSSATQVLAAASAERAFTASPAGMAASAPSPPKTKGRFLSSSAFISAEITLAPAVLTLLYRPSAIAPVELTMSATASSQPSGKGL